jgi:hypothetical protein
MHVFARICTYFGFRLLAHPFSPSCFLQISAHQAPILVSIVSFQSTARRHRSMLLNPLRLPLRWRALAAARAAARAAAQAAVVSSSSPPIMALMSTDPATAAAVESTPKIEHLESTPTAEKAIKGFLEPPALNNPRIASTETQQRRQQDVTE